MPKTGILLVNLGTPEAPTPKAVGKYLKEFLMDKRVIDIPWLFRWVLVHFLIVPRRMHASAKLYQKVWNSEGSPLLSGMRQLTGKVSRILGTSYCVKLGMRYGQPSIKHALREFKSEGVETVLVFPLYPQYSTAATLTTIEHANKVNPGLTLSFIESFYDHPLFLEAVTKTLEKAIEDKSFDKIIFSYHGLPERQIKKIKECSDHCFLSEDCCERKHRANKQCYRFQCFETTRDIAKRLSLPADYYVTAFQSRLGRTPWIRPYTDELYEKLPKEGVKRLGVISPSFTVDCLETLEEIQIRGAESFSENGGSSLSLIPCLNAQDHWVSALKEIILENLKAPKYS